MSFKFLTKKHLFSFIFCLFSASAFAQVTGSITVGGDFNKFYPTVWNDGGWTSNVPSKLEIGRSDTHTNSSWTGTVIAEFNYHTRSNGHGANFIDANIRQMWNTFDSAHIDFVAGYMDSSRANHLNNITIWLRGGGTTYYYKSLFANSPKVYDGVANPLPFVEENGPSRSYKTIKDAYVNSDGLSHQGNGYFLGAGSNYFAGTASNAV